VNVPLLPGARDDAFEKAFNQVVLPLLDAYDPDILVTQLGTDALLGDLVANLGMSLPQLERFVTTFRELRKPWLALGGGGYEVGNVVRAWTLAWARMNDTNLPDAIPAEWLTQAAPYGVTVTSLRGTAEASPSPARMLEDLDRVIDKLNDTVFPVLQHLT